MDATPKITALEHDPRRPGTVRLEVDGSRFGSVSGELVGTHGLAVGRQLEPDLLDRLGAAADIEAA